MTKKKVASMLASSLSFIQLVTGALVFGLGVRLESIAMVVGVFMMVGSPIWIMISVETGKI